MGEMTTDPALCPTMVELLDPALRQWVERQASLMGLPSPDNLILLLIRLEKQRQDLEEVPVS